MQRGEVKHEVVFLISQESNLLVLNNTSFTNLTIYFIVPEL